MMQFTRRALFGLLAGATTATAGAAAQQPINFVFIVADDLGVQDLGCYGNRYYATPNLDRLAREGMRFTSAYAACPVCSPSRAAILTGRYPVRTGVTDWIPGRKHDPRGPLATPLTAAELRHQETTLAEALAPAGYRSAAVGKWHLGGPGFSPTDQGFAVNIGGNHSGSPPPGPKPYFGPFTLPGLEAGPGEFLTAKLTEAACAFIRNQKGQQQPFFLYLAHYAPHIPLSARPEDVARHEAKAAGRYDPVYAAMVESVDESVGEILRTLEETGLARNTMVLFTSDNGGLRFEGKSKRAVTDNGPLRAGKGHLYEGGIREPLLIRLPRVTKPGGTNATPVCHVDFFPTAMALAGRPPGDVDGVSLSPLLGGGSAAGKRKARPLFWHYPHWSNQGGEPGSAIREGEWKLIEFFVDGRRELYHLDRDPGEKENLIGREPRRAARLYARLDAWRKETGAVIPSRNPQADPGWPGFGLTGQEAPTPPRD